jgi:hypothetical protein
MSSPSTGAAPVASASILHSATLLEVSVFSASSDRAVLSSSSSREDRLKLVSMIVSTFRSSSSHSCKLMVSPSASEILLLPSREIHEAASCFASSSCSNLAEASCCKILHYHTVCRRTTSAYRFHFKKIFAGN